MESMKDLLPELDRNFGFGCMRLPIKNGEIDQAQTCEMVDRFMAAGFRYFDTAHGYHGGKSETALRDCLTSRHPRESYLLTDKLSEEYFHNEQEIRPFFESQLAACGVEYFDFYLMHAQNAGNYEKYKQCRAYETAIALKAEGKIRHVGLSFHDKAPVLERILTEHPEIEIVQIQLNYVDYDDASVDSRAVYEVCEKFGKPVIVMEPVKGGSLVNLPDDAQAVLDDLQKDAVKKQSNAAYALRFCGSFPNVRMVLSGMSNMEQMLDNIDTMREFKPLSKQEFAAIDRVRTVFRAMRMIPCTACRYCVLENDCPKKIPIPELFSCYNRKINLCDGNQDDDYGDILTTGGGKASDCLRCGKCEKICPQHLEIRELLHKVAEEFEQEP